MRSVALVAPRVSHVGGTERHVCELATGLAARGLRVEVHAHVVRVPPGALDGVLVRVVGAGRGSLERAALEARGRGALVQTFGRTAHGHVVRAGGGAHGAWMARRGWRWSGVWQRLSGRDRRELQAEARALAGARIVICNSHLAAADMGSWHPGVEERVRVVRNGIDLERFRPCAARRARARGAMGVPAGGRVVAFLGNGFARKGLGDAARAFEGVATPRDRLVVAGHDAHGCRWEARLRRRLGHQLVWLGLVDQPESWLPAADAVLLPTRYDPAANTTLQAMACGVATVSTAADGSAELLPPPLVARTRGDVQRVLADIIDDSPALGRACRARAEAWPLARMVGDMVAIYAEVTDA